MRNVTIRRCPVCPSIGSRTDQLRNALWDDPDLNVRVVDGDKGEFAVQVAGRRIDGMSGENLRSADELAAEIRGSHVASA